jgi:hypothetical protein
MGLDRASSGRELTICSWFVGDGQIARTQVESYIIYPTFAAFVGVCRWAMELSMHWMVVG